MNCLTRIRQRYPTLAASDKKLADFILAQPDQTRHLSSQQLAGEAGVSQSSVVKFAQKMGFKGFPALKLALSEALAKAIKDQMENKKTTFIEVILNQELGEPFRRDAMKKPVIVAGIDKKDMKSQK